MFAIQAQRAGTKREPSPEGLGPIKPGGRAPEARHHTLHFVRVIPTEVEGPAVLILSHL